MISPFSASSKNPDTGPVSVWTHLLAALQFITVIPIRRSVPFVPSRMIPMFPVVGLILGAGLVAVDGVASLLWSRPVASLLDVVFLVTVTGGFHLDGLGDTADGLYGHRSREAALAIMKDSRVGAMGLLAMVCGLGIKWAGIAGLDAHRTLMLFIIPAYSRGAMLFGFRYLPYGRPEGGTGHAFFDDPLPPSGLVWLLPAVLLSLLAGPAAIIVNLAFAGLVIAVLTAYARRIGCITGDMLGAQCEITEAGLFLMVTAGGLA